MVLKSWRKESKTKQIPKKQNCVFVVENNFFWLSGLGTKTRNDDCSTKKIPIQDEMWTGLKWTLLEEPQQPSPWFSDEIKPDTGKANLKSFKIFAKSLART